jgi:hypothetical protein
MSDTRNLTPPIDNPESARPWKVVGLELAHKCTFCGAPSEATLGCPDESAPLIFQVGVCNSCLVDSVLRRFREVKHERVVQLSHDTVKAANAIREARQRLKSERGERQCENLLRKREFDPEIEAEATRRLADEEERIARQQDMCPGRSYDAWEADYQRAWRERR